MARDASGRVTDHIEYSDNGTTIAFRRQSTYNNASQVTYEITSGTAGSGNTTYNYGVNGSTYAGGAVVSQSGSNTNTTGQTTSFTITNSFIWRGSALQGTVSNAQSGTATTSTFTYNANNYLTQVNTTGAQAKSISYTTDSVGQIMVRTQTTNGSTTSPKDFSFYFSGAKIGAIGNNGTANVDYTQAIKDDGTVDGTGPFREGQTLGNSYADFDQNWTAVGPAAGVEGANSSYTVQAGQTLSGIASAVWGDASLWYLIAQANGLISDDAVTAGQVLVVPAKVTGSHNNAATYKPYNAAQALGDVAPGAPKPKSSNCGVLGAVLMAAVAIAVAAIVAPALIGSAAITTTATTTIAGMQVIATGTIAATGLTAAIGAVGAGIVGGAVAAAAGSVVSQLVGTRLGIQDKFSWKGVAMAAISAGVSQGLAPGGVFKNGLFGRASNPGALMTVKDVTLRTGLQGIAGSLATQGIALATRLQKEINWSGIAAAGVGSATAFWAGRSVPELTKDNSLSNHLSQLGVSGASMLANAATRSLLDGKDFGDNILAALPDVLAQSLTNMVQYAADMSLPEPGSTSGLADLSGLYNQMLGTPPSGTISAGSITPSAVTSYYDAKRPSKPGSEITGSYGPSYNARANDSSWSWGGIISWLLPDEVENYFAELRVEGTRVLKQSLDFMGRVVGMNVSHSPPDRPSERQQSTQATGNHRPNLNPNPWHNRFGPVYAPGVSLGPPPSSLQLMPDPITPFGLPDNRPIQDTRGRSTQTLFSVPQVILRSDGTRSIVPRGYTPDRLGRANPFTGVASVPASQVYVSGVAPIDASPDQHFKVRYVNGFQMSPPTPSQSSSSSWIDSWDKEWIPTTRLTDYARGRPTLLAGTLSGEEDPMVRTMLNFEGNRNYTSLGFGYHSPGFLETTGGALASAAFPGFALLTEHSSSPFVRNGGRIGAVISPWNFASVGGVLGRGGVAAERAVPKGIVYLRTDITGNLAPYGGQAINDARYLARQAEHARAFPESEFKFSIIDRANPGSGLDIAEHNFIQELTGGVAARRSSAVSNLRDPVGAARRPAFGVPEPR